MCGPCACDVRRWSRLYHWILAIGFHYSRLKRSNSMVLGTRNHNHLRSSLNSTSCLQTTTVSRSCPTSCLQTTTVSRSCPTSCLQTATCSKSCPTSCQLATTCLNSCATSCLQATTVLRSCATSCLQATTCLSVTTDKSYIRHTHPGLQCLVPSITPLLIRLSSLYPLRLIPLVCLLQRLPANTSLVSRSPLPSASAI